MRAVRVWRTGLTGKCRDEPAFCPGVIIFTVVASKRLRESLSVGDALSLMGSCDCESAKRLRENPEDYLLGVRAALECTSRLKSGECRAELPGDPGEVKAPRDTLRNLEELLSSVGGAGLVVEGLRAEAEMVYVELSAGCGSAVVAVGPVGCAKVDGDLELRLEGCRVERHRCTRTPPYLDIDAIEGYLSG